MAQGPNGARRWPAIGRAARDELQLLFVAVQFLTRVPVPAGAAFGPDVQRRSVRQYPVAGALVGIVGGCVALLALHAWPPGVAAALSVAATAWLTAGFHEDGLADAADGLFGSAPRERALQIMTDSRIGSYGCIALVTVTLVRVQALAALLTAPPTAALLGCIAAHAAGRAAAIVPMAWLPHAGSADASTLPEAKSPALASGTRWRDIVAGGLVAAGCIGAATAHAPVAIIPTLATLALLVTGYVAWLRRRLGGWTGDTLGALEQLAETVTLLALAAPWRGA